MQEIMWVQIFWVLCIATAVVASVLAIWRPRARSISWSQDGAAVALLVGEYGDDFELRSWPERGLTSRCVVRPWACCNTYVALSPRGDRAAVLWWHQSEGGINLVSLEDGAARHLEGEG